MPPLIIFDCDGVLVDSEALAARAFVQALSREGLKRSVQQVDEEFRGRSLKDCLRLVEAELGRALAPDFLERLDRETFSSFADELQPIVGVCEQLECLEQRGIARCVASSGSQEKMKLTLGLTGLLPFFSSRLFSASQVERGKPAPDLFLFAAKECGVPITQSVVIEDSLPGIAGALEAGARVLAFVQGGNLGAAERAREAAKMGAEVFSSMSELPTLLDL